MTRDDLEVLESRIREELDNIAHLRNELGTKGLLPYHAGAAPPPLPQDDSFILRSVGSIMHDFYNAAENMFKVVARDVDGTVPSHAEWHRSLLTQMSLDLPTHRPPVLKKGTAVLLDEFRSFRHVFRNVYGFVLDPDRLQLLLRKFPQAVDALTRDVLEFLDIMRRVSPDE